MSLKKEKWGPHTWIFLHSLASAATTPEKRYEFRKIIYSLAAGGLPCDECTDHFRTIVYSNSNSNDKNKDLDKYNIDKYMDSNNSLFKWTWLVHNLVNRRLDKPRIKLSEARASYFGSDAVCTDSCNANANANTNTNTNANTNTNTNTNTNANTNVNTKAKPSSVPSTSISTKTSYSKTSEEINNKASQNSKASVPISKNNSPVIPINSSHFSSSSTEHDVHPTNSNTTFNRISTISPSRSLPYSNQTRFSIPSLNNNSNTYPINPSNIRPNLSNIAPSNYTSTLYKPSTKNNSQTRSLPSHSHFSNNIISTSNLPSNHFSIPNPSHSQSRRPNFIHSSSSYPIQHYPYNQNDYVVLDFSG